jgi:predicted ester cyclase
MFHSGFPDMKISIDRIVAEEDSVAVYGKVSGTNTGPMMGTPPTGKRATFAYMDIYRIAGGQVVESWPVEDIAGMLGQLGLMPG